jgi:osmotically inducible lipoprotein OsmB
MRIKTILVPAVLGSVLMLGACADNYAVEGAALGAAAGAGIGAVTDADVGTAAAVGAAAGAVGGTLVKKNGRCYRTDRYGREYEVRC